MTDNGLILTIDDEHDITEMIALMLSTSGYRVIEAQSVFEGMKALADCTPDVILLDVMMPGVDGIRFCETLRSNPATAHVPVIFVSALGKEADRVVAREAGAAAYVTKPFTSEQLIGAIRAIVSERQASAV
ncbi:MAG: response regulator [Coriobacteriia bacterium]|nr:response regulator [Coriobacteriia bacterium]